MRFILKNTGAMDNLRYIRRYMATILIIDDESDLREIMRTFLEDEGHNVLEAENGLAGAECLNQKNVDLVVTDIVMPKQGGVEMMMSLYQQFPELKWMFISGKVPVNAEPVQSIVDKFGVANILAKPFKKERFLTAVRTALSG
jgi:DNA-binding NtrC family response regulator